MLQEYKRKRNFKITPEPAGAEPSSKKKKKIEKNSLTFVIQKHDARRLHYDFRLEIDGVMVSWAVPKGPSLSTTERRLAVMTEDHPMEYSSFEGIIPEKQYGAGEVIIWDQGIYSPDDKGEYSWDDKEEANKRMREALKRGKLTFYIKGEKIEGSWTLVKMHNKEKDWLLIKHKDQFANSETDVTQLDQSVVSGLTIADLQANGSDKIWTRRGAQKADPKTTGKSTKQPKQPAKKDQGTGKTSRKQKINALLEKAKEDRFPKKIEPMEPSHVKKPFTKEGWFFEPKLNGVRAIASITPGGIQLRGEDNDDLSSEYPTIRKALSKYQGEFIFDGLIADGAASAGIDAVDKPASKEKAQQAHRPIYCVFDILYADGKDITSLNLVERKQLLESIIEEDKHIRIIQSLGTNGTAAFNACVENGLEGVVGKRENSPYKPGVKSKLWSTVTATQTTKRSKVVHIDSVKKASTSNDKSESSAKKRTRGSKFYEVDKEKTKRSSTL